jgi:hypothetical protein
MLKSIQKIKMGSLQTDFLLKTNIITGKFYWKYVLCPFLFLFINGTGRDTSHTLPQPAASLGSFKGQNAQCLQTQRCMKSIRIRCGGS